MRLAPYAFTLAAVAVAGGCFSPDEPDCTFRCDDSIGNSGHCPDHYTCQADGYCHKNGTTSLCPYALSDASAVVMDLSTRVDAAGADQSMAGGDMASTADLRVDCNDKVKNGDETDVDCGGNTCGPCADGKTCARHADCTSMMCDMVDAGMSTCRSVPDMAKTD